MKKQKSAAVLTVFEANKMTWDGRQLVAEWLRKQAKALIKDGHLYGKVMRARYFYK
jgi:hypothetical protein